MPLSEIQVRIPSQIQPPPPPLAELMSIYAYLAGQSECGSGYVPFLYGSQLYVQYLCKESPQTVIILGGGGGGVPRKYMHK